MKHLRSRIKAALLSGASGAGYVIGLLSVALIVCVAPAQAVNPDAILGLWLSQQKNVGIEIYRHNGKYAGKIVWFKEPLYRMADPRGMGGKQRIDRENPDPAKKTRPLMGINLMWDFVFSGNNLWDGGLMYDPVHGQTYRGQISLDGQNTLQARGFVLFKLFGRTEIMTRVSDWMHLPEPLVKIAKKAPAPSGNGAMMQKPAIKAP